jgi:hypothetical protein
MTTRLLSDDWRARVNGVYVRYWLANKANRSLPKITDKKRQAAAWNRNYKELCVTTRLLNAELATLKKAEFTNAASEIAKPLDGEPTRWRLRGKPGAGYITNPEACPMFRTLVFLKYGVTFRELVCELERSPKAFDKWKRVHTAYHKMRWGDGSLDTLKLKFNFTHFKIMVQGLDFGLKGLNEWELAYCLDEICPCSQKHSRHSLKKLRKQIIKACRSLNVRNMRSTTVGA